MNVQKEEKVEDLIRTKRMRRWWNKEIEER